MVRTIKRQIGQPARADLNSVGKSPSTNVAGLKVSPNVFAARKLAKLILLHFEQTDSPVSATVNTGVARYRSRKVLVPDISIEA
jgi:hypothetical protein